MFECASIISRKALGLTTQCSPASAALWSRARDFPAFPVWITGFLGFNPNAFSPIKFRDNKYEITDSVSWVRGAHQFKFGVLLRQYDTNTDQRGTQPGRFHVQWNLYRERVRRLPAGNSLSGAADISPQYVWHPSAAQRAFLRAGRLEDHAEYDSESRTALRIESSASTCFTTRWPPPTRFSGGSLSQATITATLTTTASRWDNFCIRCLQT